MSRTHIPKEPLPREERIRCGPSTQEAYEKVVDEAATVRMVKVASYGEAGYTDPNFKRQMVIAYGDVHRKYLRIEHCILNGRLGEGSDCVDEDGETLREAFLDLANYALMGVQLIDQKKRKDGAE